MEEMKKPFTMDLDYAKLVKEGEEERKASQEKMTKPFVMDLDYAKSENKLYLILIVYSRIDGEDMHDFEFVTGRQNVYDRIKELLTANERGEEVDAMKSLIFVDSPKVQISKKLSLYRFMKDMKINDKVIDESSFDIQDYYYEEENGNEE